MDVSSVMQALLDPAQDPLALLAHAQPHWSRPLWLWALPGVLLVWWRWWRGRSAADVWAAQVDAHLRPHVLVPAAHAGRRGPWVASAVWLLAVLALAGPGWQRAPQPAFERRAPLVIALDVSSATNAADLPPSRLLQARAKIAALLVARKDGQTALVAFAGDAFTVAPLTDDPANIALFLDALSPSVMPVDGSDATRAITLARKLIGDAGAPRGDILLLTDHADAAALRAAAAAAAAGDRVSVLGLGSVAGAPYRDGNDQLASARLDPASLAALAAAGGGRYQSATVDLADVARFDFDHAAAVASARAQTTPGATWKDQGYWLLLPLLLFAALAFRRGIAVLALVLWLPLAMPVHAADAADPVQGGLWQRADQAQAVRMQAGDVAYARGDYTAAATAWRALPGATAAYNLGNAEAMRGNYTAAIAAYQRALALQPGMADADANLRLVSNAQRRQQEVRTNPVQHASSESAAQQGVSQPPSASAAGTGNTEPPAAPAAHNTAQSSASGSAPVREQAPPAGNGPAAVPPSGSGARAGGSAQAAAAPAAGQAGDKSAHASASAGTGEGGRMAANGAGKTATPGAQAPAAPQRPADNAQAMPDSASARAKQADADAAQRARMQAVPAAAATRTAMANAARRRGAVQVDADETPAERAERQAVQAQLQRVQDDPGGLLRRRFLLEYRRRMQEGSAPP